MYRNQEIPTWRSLWWRVPLAFVLMIVVIACFAIDAIMQHARRAWLRARARSSTA